VALTRAEKEQLAALQEKAKAPRRPREDTSNGIYVLSGAHADKFLDKLFGPDDDEPDDDEPDDDEPDDDEPDDDVEPDPQSAARSHKFFGGSRRG